MLLSEEKEFMKEQLYLQNSGIEIAKILGIKKYKGFYKTSYGRKTAIGLSHTITALASKLKEHEEIKA
jgi:hypothetical protein